MTKFGQHDQSLGSVFPHCWPYSCVLNSSTHLTISAAEKNLGILFICCDRYNVNRCSFLAKFSKCSFYFYIIYYLGHRSYYAENVYGLDWEQKTWMELSQSVQKTINSVFSADTEMKFHRSPLHNSGHMCEVNYEWAIFSAVEIQWWFIFGSQNSPKHCHYTEAFVMWSLFLCCVLNKLKPEQNGRTLQKICLEDLHERICLCFIKVSLKSVCSLESSCQ